MTLLMQISDLHFGTEQPAVVSALRRLAHAQRPQVLVVSGDITQRARPAQFAAARAFCDSLAVPQMLALPGNHDIALANVFERLIRPYRRYLARFGPALETVIDTPEFRVIGVHTTRRWRHKNGEVSPRQIENVCGQLHGAPASQLRLVVVHQPIQVMRASDEHDRLIGWEAAARAWAAAGADAVLGGHIHLPYALELSPRIDGLARRMWCVQAGTALSSRVRWEAPNSVNLLRPVATGTPGEPLRACHVERWDYRADSDEFERVKTDIMRPERR